MIVWQDPPPYVQYAEEAAALARLSLSAGVCSNLRYTVDRDAGAEEVQAYVRRAIIDRVGREYAESTFAAAIDTESAEWRFMTGEQSGQDADAALADAARFFVVRCSEASAAYPAVISADGDEPKTASELIDLVLAQEQQ